jgi:MFS family permease
MAAAVQPASPAPASVPHPLRERDFRMFWAGSAISLLGDQFYLVALPWVVLQLTGSAIAMGAIMMAAAIPRAALMLLGGALTDRTSPRKILMHTASTRAIFVAAVGFLLWFHRLQTWELYLLGFGFGVADAFSAPAALTFLPSLVRQEQLTAANSVVQTTAQFTSIAGPTPAALVIKWLGTAWAFFLDAISFLFIIAALWRLPDPVKTAAGRPPLWRSIGDGFASVRRDVPLRSLILLIAMLNLCTSGPMGVGLPYLTKTRFDSPAAFAFLVSCAAAGGLVGALVAGLWKVRRRGLFILGACAFLGVCLASIGLANRLWLIAGVLVLMTTAAGITNVNIIAWIQKRVEPALRGRVMSVVMLFSFGLLPFSLAGAGFLITWNLRWTFILAGALMLMITGFGALQKQVREIE